MTRQMVSGLIETSAGHVLQLDRSYPSGPSHNICYPSVDSLCWWESLNDLTKQKKASLRGVDFSLVGLSALLHCKATSDTHSGSSDANFAARVATFRTIAQKLSIDGYADDWYGLATFDDAAGDANGMVREI